jgi:ketosteroid isomerase-like protein
MAEEPDWVALTRRSMEATNARDFASALDIFADDAVFDMSAAGLGRFEGANAIRRYLEDWIGAYEDQHFREWNGEHLGSGVVFVTALLEARMAGGETTVSEAWTFTVVWKDGRIARVVADQDAEQARRAAVRLTAAAARACRGRS